METVDELAGNTVAIREAGLLLEKPKVGTTDLKGV
jgi:hypothetical protein